MKRVEGRIIISGVDLTPEKLFEIELYLNSDVDRDVYRLYKSAIRVHVELSDLAPGAKGEVKMDL